MKTFFLQVIILLLSLGISCRKREAEPEKPINLANCRIVKVTYWDGYGVRPQTEVIEAEGVKFTVKQFRVTHYTYNEKGQIIREQPEAGCRTSLCSLLKMLSDELLTPTFISHP